MKHWPLPKTPEYVVSAKSGDGMQLTAVVKFPGHWFSKLGLHRNNIVSGSFIRVDKG